MVLAGSAAGWLPPGFTVLPQRTGGLADRLPAAFTDAHQARPVPMLLIGMDTPQLTPALLRDAVRQLLRPGTDAVIGPADDGGGWALGPPTAGLFNGVAMSTSRTGAAQRDRLTTQGLRTAVLPRLRDLDHVGDTAPIAA